MNGYVASKFENKEEVRRVQKLLREAGHSITHDWTVEDATGLTGEVLEAYLRRCAEKDLAGVENCDFLFLLNYLHCAGSYTEFGMALALRRLVVVVDGRDPTKSRNIFFHLPNVYHFTSVEAAVDFVNSYAKNRVVAGG